MYACIYLTKVTFYLVHFFQTVYICMVTYNSFYVLAVATMAYSMHVISKLVL